MGRALRPGNARDLHDDLVVGKRELASGVVEIEPNGPIFLNIASEAEVVGPLHGELGDDVRQPDIVDLLAHHESIQLGELI